MNVDENRLKEYLKKIKGSVCPLCGANKWEISNKIFQAPEFDKKGLLLNGASYPIVPLTCTNCGNTYFINALVANFIDRDSDNSSEQKPPLEENNR